MTEEDAGALGVAVEDRLQYARLDDAKANLAPRAPKASWYHLSHVTLDNADEVYPNGDQVVVIETWEPPSVWDSVSDDDSDRALDAGLPGGVLYTDNRRGDASRWAGTVLVEMFSVTEDQAATIIKAWLHNGVLTKETYHDKSQRKDRIGLFVNATKRPGGR
jgi:hypothetical protein